MKSTFSPGCFLWAVFLLHAANVHRLTHRLDTLRADIKAPKSFAFCKGLYVADTWTDFDLTDCTFMQTNEIKLDLSQLILSLWTKQTFFFLLKHVLAPLRLLPHHPFTKKALCIWLEFRQWNSTHIRENTYWAFCKHTANNFRCISKKPRTEDSIFNQERRNWADSNKKEVDLITVIYVQLFSFVLVNLFHDWHTLLATELDVLVGEPQYRRWKNSYLRYFHLCPSLLLSMVDPISNLCSHTFGMSLFLSIIS